MRTVYKGSGLRGAVRTNKRTRKINTVTAAVNGFEPDHFKFTDIGKGIAKGITKLVVKDPEKERAALAKIDANSKSKAANILNKVAGVGLGIAAGLTGVKAIKGDFKKEPTTGSGAPMKVDTSAMGGMTVNKPDINLPGSPNVIRSMTPAISPLMPSAPAAKADPIINDVINSGIAQSQATGQPLGEILKASVADLKQGDINSIVKRGTDLVNKGTGTLTAAQKKLKQLSSSILPKTKSVKEAEQLLTLPQAAANVSATPVNMTPEKWMYIGIAVIIVIVGLYMVTRKG